jgi:hypothetical protein
MGGFTMQGLTSPLKKTLEAVENFFSFSLSIGEA